MFSNDKTKKKKKKKKKETKWIHGLTQQFIGVDKTVSRASQSMFSS